MTKGQYDSENQVFSKQKGKTFKNIRNMKDGPRSWSNSLQIYPSKATPSHTVRPEAPCTWVAYPISQEVLHAVNHIGLEWTGP